MPDLSGLRTHLDGLGRVLLGYSGGVDSALLGVVGADTLGPDRFLAVIGISPSYPEAQLQVARDLALRFALPVLELETHELDDPRYAANPTSRCYFCKTELWSRLREVAEARGFETIIDGTNLDDLGDHRPGLRAAEEREVVSPLVDLAWTKADVRAAARELGIPIWNAPSQPCLASRIRFGLEVTAERLGQVERAEEYLRALGVTGDLRVRHHERTARIEVETRHHAPLEACWDDLVVEFRTLGFKQVELDMAGYRRGSLLVLEAAPERAGVAS
jgi:uncharacterized protein